MTSDRDQSIDQLLRQARATDPTAPPANCPDAETLAAFADDTLTAPLRREVEGHIADCHRCQELTAAIARADTPVGAPAGVVGDVPAWRRRWFNWLVPAAAAATAVALWVLVPGQRTPLPEEPAPQAQIATAPSSSAPPSSEVITSEPLQIPVDGFADSAARESDANRRFESGTPAAPPASPPPPAAAPAEQSLKAAAPVVGGVQDSRDAPAAAPPSANTAADQRQAAVQERRNEAAQTEAAASAPQERALNRPAAPVAGVGAAAESTAARVSGGFEVMSPNPRIRWRVSPGPAVQRSADGGATWATQQTGAATQLVAGSAPTPEVCWLVGRGGTVVRTIDAGRQWQRVPFPETVDLTAITASTARNATVSLADGRRFTTGDGGMTWILVR